MKAAKKLMMMVGIAGLIGTGVLEANERPPAGYKSIAEVDQAIALAVEKNQLIVLQVKGTDDKSEKLKEVIRNGERAIGPGVVKVFARAEALNAVGAEHLPEGLQERAAKKFPSGTNVVFLVFRPDMSKLLIEAGRSIIEDDSMLADFKKEVANYKKDLKL